MVDALWGIGRRREAEELFERLLELRNDVGLLSEEYDTRAGRLVGNFPQAFTHLALRQLRLQLSGDGRRQAHPPGILTASHGGVIVRLENKVVIVTGSSLGIGRSIAVACAREGPRSPSTTRSHPEEGDEAVEEIQKEGGKAISVQADVSNPDDVKALVQRTVHELGHLDVMVNNAGLEEKMPFLETPLEVWEKVISVNLTGVWLGSRRPPASWSPRATGGA